MTTCAKCGTWISNGNWSSTAAPLCDTCAGRPQYSAATVSLSSAVPVMTLRDWFAGQVLANANICADWRGPKVGAQMAYEYADAMLAAREKKP